MMNVINRIFGFLWRKKLVISTALASFFLFFIWMFPFSDLSQTLTSQIYAGSGNQVYIQFETLDLSLIPKPAISGTGVTVETALPPLEASWLKISPSLLDLLLNIGTLSKAGNGDPEAQRSLASKLGFSVAAEGLLGADVDLSMGAGKKSERGADRSRINLFVEGLDLRKVQEWSDLPMKMQGQAELSTDLLINPDFQDQPEGEFALKANQFVMPASTVMIPIAPGAEPMAMSLPGVTLANVNLKARLSNGNMVIEEGVFGQAKDPIYGRIRGNMAVRFLPSRGSVQPVPGDYNLTLDLTTSAAFEKEFGYLKLFLQSCLQPVSGGSRYLCNIRGRIGQVPQTSPVSTF